MNSHFKHIEPGDLNNWHQISPRFGVVESPLKDAAFEVVNLADSARYFFAGLFPSPAYFPEYLISLPWCDEYHTSDANGWTYRLGLIAAEVSRVAAELGPVDPSEYCPITYDSKILCASEKTVLQGLAVETMLLADGCISLLLEAKVVAALPWLSAAYRRIIDCARQAQDIVDLANGTRDQVPLEKINPTKELVLRWYAQRKDAFPSLDAAAEALVGWVKLAPISVATAREWIGEWSESKDPIAVSTVVRQ